MKKIITSALFILTILLSTYSLTNASHLTGGELTYEYLGGNGYKLNLSLYRDCSGISAPSTVDIDIRSASCAIATMTVTLNQIFSPPFVISNVCPGDSSNCNGGTIPGVEHWLYSGIVTLPLNCPDYVFMYNECCRNNNITNLISVPSDFTMQYRTTLDNLNAPFNNSPLFGGNSVIYLSSGTLQTIDYRAYDSDGDSLSYNLVAALDSLGVPLQYNSPLDSLNPISSSTPISLDPITGVLTVTPIGPEVDVVAIQINEYRNGSLIGTVRHDIQISVSATVNHTPVLSGINGSTSYVIQTCAGDTLSFMLYSSDADNGDSTFFIVYPMTGAYVSISSFGSAQDSALIKIVTDASLIGTSPYNIRIRISDNKCPFQGTQVYYMPVYINSCSDDIWPGDADSDLKCDLYDVFPIGLAYGSTGPIRSGATTNWIAETATNWSQDFNSGVNFKHTDCNGDGIIDMLDTAAITLNYGLTHPVRFSEPNFIQTTSSLYLSPDKDSVGPSETFSVKVRLGSNLDPVNTVYGVAFVLRFNPILTDSTQSSFNFLPSNLGTPASDLLTYTKINWRTGKIYGVAVRTDQNNSFSDTSIASFDVKIINNISVNTFSLLTLSGVRAITADGITQALNSVDDSVYVNTSSIGLNDLTEAFAVYLFPNPAQNELFILSDAKSEGSITIHDISGRKIMETTTDASKSKIDISPLSNGIYAVGVKTDAGLVWGKLIVSR